MCLGSTPVSQRDSGELALARQQRMFNDTPMGKLDVVDCRALQILYPLDCMHGPPLYTTTRGLCLRCLIRYLTHNGHSAKRVGLQLKMA